MCPRQAVPYPLPRYRGHRFEVPEEMWNPPLSPPAHPRINISTPRSRQNSVWPRSIRYHFVIDSSHRFLNRATRNGKHGSMSGTGPSAGGRAATPPQTTTRLEMSGNASRSHSERQQDQHFWAACRIGGPGFPSEPDLLTLADISPAPRKPAAESRRTTIGSRYRRTSASTNPVTTLNPADASDSFSTGSQSLAKFREECSVVVMDSEEEDSVSARFR